jgi:hypothetical protein
MVNKWSTIGQQLVNQWSTNDVGEKNQALEKERTSVGEFLPA